MSKEHEPHEVCNVPGCLQCDNPRKTPQPEWEDKFDIIFSEEAQGILVMNSKQRFDFCERVMNYKGKIKSFIREILATEKEKALTQYKEELKELFEDLEIYGRNRAVNWETAELKPFLEILKKKYPKADNIKGEE